MHIFEGFCLNTSFSMQENNFRSLLAADKNAELLYRGQAMFKFMEGLHKIVFEQTKKLLLKKFSFDNQIFSYLEELTEFSLMRKKDVFAVDHCPQKLFHFDFIALMDDNFNGDSGNNFMPNGINILLSHTESQKVEILGFLKLYSKEYELGNIMSTGNSFENFFRKPIAIS